MKLQRKLFLSNTPEGTSKRSGKVRGRTTILCVEREPLETGVVLLGTQGPFHQLS